MNKKKISYVKEIKDPTFKINVGTMDKNFPYAFYVEGKTFLIPQETENIKELYEKSVCDFKKKVLKYTTKSNYVKSFPKPIVSTDIAIEQLKHGKNSKMKFHCFFVQKNNPLLPIKDMGDEFYKDFSSIVNGLKEKFIENGFLIQKEKM